MKKSKSKRQPRTYPCLCGDGKIIEKLRPGDYGGLLHYTFILDCPFCDEKYWVYSKWVKINNWGDHAYLPEIYHAETGELIIHSNNYHQLPRGI